MKKYSEETDKNFANEAEVGVEVEEEEEEEEDEEEDSQSDSDDLNSINNLDQLTIHSDNFSQDDFRNYHFTSDAENKKSRLRTSLFNLDPVLIFPASTDQENYLNLQKKLKDGLLWKVSKFTPKVVKTVLLLSGFTMIRKGKEFVGCWGKHYSNCRFKSIKAWQKVNHFPLAFELGRKDKLYQGYLKMRECNGEKEFNYMPETFLLPMHAKKLQSVFLTEKLWIVKPPASARGIGIKLVSQYSEITPKKDLIVSRYISNPYLVRGKKFDLRVYVLVTSYDPLKCYIYKDGICRFASEDYTNSLKKSEYSNKYVHLTNWSINKKKKKNKWQEKIQADDEIDYFSTSENKWNFKKLKDYFKLENINFENIFNEIKNLVKKTISQGHSVNLSGVRANLPHKDSCYELYGFDILLDSKLKPWLMEVNISPALKSTSQLDFDTKQSLVTDLFNLIGIKLKNIKICRDLSVLRKKPSSRSLILEKDTRTINLPVKDENCPVGKFLNTLKRYELKVIQETEDELNRIGNFDVLFPSNSSSDYSSIKSTMTKNDLNLMNWLLIKESDLKLNLKKLISFSNILNNLKFGVKESSDVLSNFHYKKSINTEHTGLSSVSKLRIEENYIGKRNLMFNESFSSSSNTLVNSEIDTNAFPATSETNLSIESKKKNIKKEMSLYNGEVLKNMVYTRSDTLKSLDSKSDLTEKKNSLMEIEKRYLKPKNAIFAGLDDSLQNKVFKFDSSGYSESSLIKGFRFSKAARGSRINSLRDGNAKKESRLISKNI